MQTNNTLLAEISALVLAALLVIGGVVLLFFGKIDWANAVYFFLSALGIFGLNSAFKAPSPTQQAALQQLAMHALSTQAQPAQLLQTSVLPPQGGSVVAPVAAPQAAVAPLIDKMDTAVGLEALSKVK